MTHKNILGSLQISELFFLMSNNEENSTLSLRAYNELMNRYNSEFSKICKEVCRKNNFEKIRDLDEEVLRISKEEIYLRCKSFDLSKKKISKKSQEKYFLGWIGNIAERVLTDIISENNKFEERHNLLPDFPDFFNHTDTLKSFQIHIEDIEEEEKLSDAIEEARLSKLRIFARAMKRLKPREREILLEWAKIKKGRTNLTKNRIVYLCRRFKTTHDNLLHIKHQAIKKLYRLFLDEQKKEANRTAPTHTGGTKLC